MLSAFVILMVSATFCCFVFCVSVAVYVCCINVYIEYQIEIICGIHIQMNM